MTKAKRLTRAERIERERAVLRPKLWHFFVPSDLDSVADENPYTAGTGGYEGFELAREQRRQIERDDRGYFDDPADA